MHDPYGRDTPGVSDPANNLITITPDDAEDLSVGVKALRIFNPNTDAATIALVTMLGKTVTLTVPASCVWIEPVRALRVLETGTTAELVIHGYTDA